MRERINPLPTWVGDELRQGDEVLAQIRPALGPYDGHVYYTAIWREADGRWSRFVAVTSDREALMRRIEKRVAVSRCPACGAFVSYSSPDWCEACCTTVVALCREEANCARSPVAADPRGGCADIVGAPFIQTASVRCERAMGGV